MSYTPGGKPINFEYKTEEATSIVRKSETKDPGIVMSDDRKFHEQNKKPASKGR